MCLSTRIASARCPAARWFLRQSHVCGSRRHRSVRVRADRERLRCVAGRPTEAWACRDAWSGQRLLSRHRRHRQQRLAFGLIEQRQLRRIGLDRLLGLAIEQAVAQQLDLFFQVDDVSGVGLIDLLHACTNSIALKKHLLEQYRVVRKVIGHWSYGPDYTGSGNETEC